MKSTTPFTSLLLLLLLIVNPAVAQVENPVELTRLTIGAGDNFDDSTESPVGISPAAVVTVLTRDSVFLVNQKRMNFYRYLHAAARDNEGKISGAIDDLELGIFAFSESAERLLRLQELNGAITARFAESGDTLDKLERSIELQNQLITRQAEQLLRWEDTIAQENRRRNIWNILGDGLKIGVAVGATVLSLKYL